VLESVARAVPIAVLFSCTENDVGEVIEGGFRFVLDVISSEPPPPPPQLAINNNDEILIILIKVLCMLIFYFYHIDE
jgi:hypothetical protein